MEYNTNMQPQQQFQSIGGNDITLQISQKNKVSISIYIVNAALIYILASLYYIVMTTILEKEQEKKQIRHFYLGLILSCVIIWYFQPIKYLF